VRIEMVEVEVEVEAGVEVAEEEAVMEVTEVM